MKRKLRILHIGNGAAFKIRAIIEGQLARGHEIHVIPIPPTAAKLNAVTWHRLDSPLPGPLQTLHRMFKVRRLVRRMRPDVVHAHNAWGPGWFGAAAGMHPFVIHAYGGDFLPEQYQDRPGFQRHLTSWACRSADRIVVTGHHMIAAGQHLGIAPSQIRMLPRGVDLRQYRPALDTAALRASLDLGKATPVILSPRYQVDEPLYNLDVVIHAFVEIRQHFPDAVCLQMYDPNRRSGIERLEALAAAHGLGRSYRLVPAVDNASMPLFYNLADVAVSVPSSDGFPVTVLEASACGCPLVVSELPYCKEWFVARQNGLLVPAGDSRALAEAVFELSSDRGLSQRIAAAGRQLVEQKADYERCTDALESLYFELLGETSLLHADTA
jgi:glycosyltransferase involved in cell wall biosynthesis